MSSVDDRIVNMTFNNQQFIRGATESEKALTNLDRTLANSGKSRGLEMMGKSVEGVKAKFSALQVAGVAALATIVSKATMAAGRFIKSLTIDPIIAGFKEYQTNLNSIQTIMSNTGENVKTVNSYLDKLNTYSDKTIYNFSEMAKNIGTFTAAGVDLKTSTASIKGIANLAALSGSNSQQASTAMYQLSQAISAGKVGLQDWNSVVNAGMGGKIFQTALARTAQNMGTLGKESIKTVGPMKKLTVDGKSFRESIMAQPGQQSWLSGEALVETLKQMSGGFSDAELKAKGYTQAQIKEIQQLAKTGFEAATQIKTLPQLVGVIQESIGSTFSAAFRTIIGDFKQSKALWTSVGDAIIGKGGILTGIQDRFLGTLDAWADLGGRDTALAAFKNIFSGLGQVVSTFADAWKNVFGGGMTGQDLFNLTQGFREFTASLIPSQATLENLKSIFSGLFSALDIGWQIIKGVASVIGDLIGVVAGGSGGFLNFAGGIGDMITNFDKALKSGEGLAKFFDGLGAILSIPLELIMGIGDIIGGLFSGFDKGAGDGVEGSLGRIGDRISSISEFAENAKEAISNFFNSVKEFLGPVGEAIGNAFSSLGDAIAGAMSSGNFDAVFDALNTGLLGGLVFYIRKFFTDGLSVDLTGGMFDSIKESFGALTGSMQTMQQNVKADTLMKIAIAIGILTASVVALSLIDSKKMTSALAGMAAGFTELLAAMQILTMVSKSAGLVKVPFIAVSLSLLATSILILSAAITVMSKLSWDEIARGLTATAGALVIIAGAMRIMPKNMIAQSVALMAVGVALGEIAGAMHIMAMLSWEEIAKGMGGMAGALLGIALAMRIMPKNILLQAAALAVLGLALNAISKAIADMSDLSWEEIARGVTGLAGALGAIAIAMKLMPKGMVLQAAALLILSQALQGIGNVITTMSEMSWEDVGQGLTTLAGALVIIAAAMSLMPMSLPITAAGLLLVAIALKSIGTAIASMAEMSWEEVGKGLTVLGAGLLIIAAATNAMSGAIVGAAAMVIVAAALRILTPVLTTLGGMSWSSIAKGLLALAGTFVVIGVAGYLLAPVIPIIIGLGAAITLMGAGMALAGIGMLAFGGGVALIVKAVEGGIGVMVNAIKAFVKLLPSIATGLGKAFVSFLQTLAANSKKIRTALGQLLSNMLGVIRDNLPKIAKLFGDLLDTAIRIISEYVPKFVELGFRIIDEFLKSANRHIPDITRSAIDLVVKFVNTLANNVNKLADAGANLIIKTINAISSAIDKHSGELRAAGVNLARSIIDGLTGGLLTTGVSLVNSAVARVSALIPSGLRKWLDAHSPARSVIPIGESIGLGLAKGIGDSTYIAVGAAAAMANAVISTVGGVVDASIAAAQGGARRAQGKAFYAQSAADIRGTQAEKLQRAADRAQKKADKVSGKDKAKKKAATKRANAAQRKADRAADAAAKLQTNADAAQAAADKAAENVVAARAFVEADTLGKAQIKDELANTLATDAQAMLAKANAEAAEADRLQKTNKKAAAAMRAQAKKDADAAAALAAQAQQAHAEALGYYQQARAEMSAEVRERIGALRSEQVAEQQRRDEEAAYDVATTTGKAEIMEARAQRSQNEAAAATAAFNAAIAQAEALADVDPEKAMAWLDEAERQAQIANEAANAAKDQAEQAKQLRQQAEQEAAAGGAATGGGGTTAGGGAAGGGGTIIQPSRTALEDAAKVMDRYTESLMQAEVAAGAAERVVQFIQTNTSPKALSVSEIYRQSKNLLSAQEVKMGASSN